MESAYQFLSRPDCNNTAEVPSFTLRTALSSIPFVFLSVWCRRTMIPGKIFTGFAKFPGTASVNDFRFPIWLEELLQGPFVFPEKVLFCKDMTGSIGWSSPAPRLHMDDCFEIHNFHWELCNLLLSSHKIFCTKYGSTNTSSARCPRDFGPLADLAISVFREVSINTVFTQILASRRRRL